MAKQGLLVVKGYEYPNAYLKCPQPDIINGLVMYQIFASKDARDSGDDTNIIDGGIIQVDKNVVFKESLLKQGGVSPRVQAYAVITEIDEFKHLADV